MQLYFSPSCHWEMQRYHYPAEQMMLTLFPGEKPEYPAEMPDVTGGTDGKAIFTLHRGNVWAVLSARVYWQGDHAAAQRRFPAQALDETPEKVYHTIQRALKMAFYTASIKILQIEPPWGALTGVRPVKLPTRTLAAGGTRAQAERMMRQQYHVTPRRAELAVDCARASLAVDRVLGEREVSLYIGIPFCPSRCAYCSFVSADVSRTLKLVDPYLQALLTELECTGQALRQAGVKIRSLYVGGGTPTTLSAEQLELLLTRMEETLPLEACDEYTVEAGRPDTITREKLEALARHKIGRISINPQTLEDPVLTAIGRKHSSDEIRQAFALAREVGFSCINMDLIAGLPRDSYDGFRRSLDGVLAMGPENITVHTLALKKGSRLMEQGGAIPSGEEVARMLDYSLDTLRPAGYVPYYLYRQKFMSGALENVGWTRPGCESIYNIVMMEELQSVISVGGGGVTKLVDRDAGKIVRLPNPKYPHDYLTMFEKVLDQKQQIPPFFAR